MQQLQVPCPSYHVSQFVYATFETDSGAGVKWYVAVFIATAGGPTGPLVSTTVN